jgi:hypothetical protein
VKLAEQQAIKGTRVSRVPELVIGASLVAVIAVPLDFVQTGRGLFIAVLSLTIFGAVVGGAAILARRNTAAVVTLGLLGLVVLTSGLSEGRFPAAALTVAPILIGMAYAPYVTLRRAAVLVHLMVVLIIIETLLRQHFYSELFGDLLFPSYSGVGFRPRGLLGQAVPAALTGVAIAGGTAVWAWRKGAANWLVILLSLEAVFLSIISGTRSSLILLAVLAAILLIAIPALGGGIRVNGASRAWLTVAGALGLAGILMLPQAFWKIRVFDFGALSESSSGIVRSGALEVLGRISDSCGGPCVVLGHGVRSLQEALTSGQGILGFSTIDNMFLSLFWDGGAIALALLLAAIIVFWRSVSKHAESAVVAAGITGLLIIFSGLFYDAFYVRPTALVFGVCLGFALVSAKKPNRPEMNSNMKRKGA